MHGGFAIAYSAEAAKELSELRARDRVWILQDIARHLRITPFAPPRKRKRISRPRGGFIFQLRVGDFRVCYDVDLEMETVVVRHDRRKGRGTTGEIL